MPDHGRDSFYPSSLEHRPLMRVEKTELLNYLEREGGDQLGELPCTRYASEPALQSLEAWIWGMRFWGREVLVRSTFPILQMLLPLWEPEVEAHGGDAVSQAVIFKTLTPVAQQVSAVQNWAERPGLSTARIAGQRYRRFPEAWHGEEGRTLRKRVFFWIAQAGNAAVYSVIAHRDEAARWAGECAIAGTYVLMSKGHKRETAVPIIRTTLREGLRDWLLRYY